MNLETIQRHIYANYGLQVASFRSLPGYADQNYLVRTEDQQQYVWKISDPSTPIDALQAQNEAMLHLHAKSPGFRCPKPLATSNGVHLVSRYIDGTMRQTRLLTWLDGTPLAQIETRSPELHRQCGQFLGQLTSNLADFAHIGARRDIEWDLSQPLCLASQTTSLVDPQHKRIVDHLFLRLESHGVARISQLRKSIAHNDANDYNLLVSNETLSGLIDFGDLTYTTTASEAAVAASYLMLHQADPLDALYSFIEGYHEAWPLLPEEQTALLDLIYARLAISLTNSARMAASHPNPEYLKISEGPIWELLDKLLCISDERFIRTVQAACTPTRVLEDAPLPLLERRRAVLAANLSLQTEPAKHVVRGIGPYLYCGDGSILLDLVNNVSHVGHTHPKVVRAATRQNSILNTNSRFLHPYRSEYAQRLCDTLPSHLDTCFLVCTGSEANELALRLAMTYTNRKRVVVSDSAYHGHTSALIGLSPYKCNGPGGEGPAPDVQIIHTPDPYRGPFTGPNSAGLYLDEAKQVLADNECAAVFMESLLGCGGQIIPPEGYLAGLFDLARAHGAVAIADEVQVGFGRVGTHFWAFDAQGARPDIVTMGKPIGNGHPMAAVVTTRDIATAFCNGMEYFNTFGGNPVSCAVGLAMLDVLQQEDLQHHAHQMGEHMMRSIRTLAAHHPFIGDVRGLGLFIGIEIIDTPVKKNPNPQAAKRIKESLLKYNILISIDGPQHNVLKIKPPMVLGPKDIAYFLSCFERVLDTELSQKI